jgi:hypothetical protein
VLALTALGDVDGDGDPDLILGTSSSNQDQLYLNDGAGVFSVGAAPSPHQDSTRRVALGDVDNDGDLDLMALTSSLGACLYANDGAGLFLDLSRPRIPTDILQADAVALADVDNDGDIDAVFGTDGGQNRLLLNNGAGTFIDVTATHVPVDNDHTREIWFGDVDGDGDLDLVIGNSGAQNRLYRNDGPASPGHFTDVTTSHLPPEVDSTLGLALGDVDNDGDLDLLTGNTMGQQNRLYLNDGSGHFSDVTAIQLPPDSDATTVVVLVDVDNDGDLDLLTGNGGGGGGQQNQLYINAGTGIFAGVTASQMPPALDPTTSMAPGDVDGDGDVDLVIGNCGAQNRLYLNDGPANRGYFIDVTATHMPPDYDITRDVALADSDDDGDLDIVTGNSSQQNRVYLNDGAGVFTDVTSTSLPIKCDYTSSVALGDVDGDGDLDLAFANTIGTNHLYINLLRQLDTPLFPLMGAPYRLDVYSRHGATGGTDLALVDLSFLPASPPIPVPPFGTIGIDITTMVVLPMLQVPQPAGVGSVTLQIPTLPALAGRSLYTQAIVAVGPGQIRLTNVVSDPIH